MRKVIMGIGIPGSGKTTALKSYAEKYSYSYICPDDIRAEFTGDAHDQSRNREVWQEAYSRTEHALQNGETVVFDATFAKGDDRKRFISFVREHGAEKVQGVFATTSLEVAKERNDARERVVPSYAIERMHSMLKSEPPSIEDGFDSLFDINEIQELERAETRINNETHIHEFKEKLQ